MKLSEYDYIVEHRPGTRMRHADVLSRNVNLIGKDLILSKEIIQEEQAKDELCKRYKQYEDFWTDRDGVLYRQGSKEPPCIVIPIPLVPTVLKCYHELPFTAHQGVNRTVEFISKKYWWETMRNDVVEFIRGCEACAKRKTGHRIKAPLGEALEAHEFLDVVSLDIVGPLPVTERGQIFIDFCGSLYPLLRSDPNCKAGYKNYRKGICDENNHPIWRAEETFNR
jgi:hypothetical protein